MSDDLKQRLRKVEGGNHYGATVWYKNPDGPEAADRIEQLDASSEGWKDIADEYFDAICERNTRIEKLEAALREIVQVWDTDQPISIARAALARDVARKTLEGKDD